MKRIIGIAVCVLALSGQPAWAARTQIHEAAESQAYGRKFGGMIGRGVLNAVTCFVDVIVNIVNDTKAGPPVVGTLTGVAKGTGCGVLRLGSGAIDLVTFWVPGFNGFPVSDSYENCFAASAPATAAPMVPNLSAPEATMPSPPEPESVATPSATATPASTPAPQPHHVKRKWTK